MGAFEKGSHCGVKKMEQEGRTRHRINVQAGGRRQQIVRWSPSR